VLERITIGSYCVRGFLETLIEETPVRFRVGSGITYPQTLRNLKYLKNIRGRVFKDPDGIEHITAPYPKPPDILSL
jgi:hypothetical protein